jgi:hypothetical protein
LCDFFDKVDNLFVEVVLFIKNKFLECFKRNAFDNCAHKGKKLCFSPCVFELFIKKTCANQVVVAIQEYFSYFILNVHILNRLFLVTLEVTLYPINNLRLYIFKLARKEYQSHHFLSLTMRKEEGQHAV